MTDANRTIMPDAWRDIRHPRRDRPHVPQPSGPAPDLVEGAKALVDGARDEIENVLALPGTAPELADAGRAHLRGGATPLGAAVVVEVLVALSNMYPDDARFLHAWAAGHGLPFAAAVCAESGGITTWGRHGYAPVRSSGVRYKAADEMQEGGWLTETAARWLRTHLAAAPDGVYAAAVEELAARRGHESQRLIAAYLAPTREDWVEDLCANPVNVALDRGLGQRWLLFCALGRPHQPAAFGAPLRLADSLDVLLTLVDGVGPEAAVPLIVEAVDDQHGMGYVPGTLVEVLAELPVDDAFRALLDRIDRPGLLPALTAAARNFPERGMRLLPGSKSGRAADALAAHVRAHPDLAEAVLPALPAGEGKAIRRILDANPHLPDATDLPPLLAEPPWTRPRKKAKPVVVKDLPSPGVRAVAWEPGEREERTKDISLYGRPGLADAAAKYAAGDLDDYEETMFFLTGPEDEVRPLLADWNPPMWGVHHLRTMVGRFELDVVDAVLRVGNSDSTVVSEALLPILTDEVARMMADWLVRLKSAGETARTWFGRHGLAAAPPLVPDALGKAGPARRAAGAALRLLADRHGPGPIVEAARVHGDRAAAAVEAVLAADPADEFPKKIPSVDWVDLRVLPRLAVRDRTRALPDAAVRHVLTMLAMSGPGDEYAGVAAVRELCDPASLAEFGWALFRWWDACGAPPKDKWALAQLALTGDDGTVRRLAPVIRAWPGEGGHARAVTGLDVLAAIGTDTALMNLHGIAQRVKFKGLKTKAQEKIAEVAAGLDLTADELGDRLVPDFGLDASGTLVLDYGPRRFVIGFDEQLKPTITDEDGKLRKSLPKPGVKDDPDLAPAAAKQFAALKKEARTVASDQLARLEHAMVARRRWPLAEFRELLADHPLVGHLVRRLVWTACSPEQDGPAFRVVEDGTFADVHDDAVDVPAAAEIALAHPAVLGDGELEGWTQVFADYEILQPFPQLGRPVHTLTDDERESGRLTRFQNAKVPPGALLGLAGRDGWERGGPMDAGVEAWTSRPVGDGRYAVVAFRPGITVDLPGEFGDQTITDVLITERPEDVYFERHPDTPHRFGDLDPVTASELLADLARLTGKDA